MCFTQIIDVFELVFRLYSIPPPVPKSLKRSMKGIINEEILRMECLTLKTLQLFRYFMVFRDGQKIIQELCLSFVVKLQIFKFGVLKHIRMPLYLTCYK